MDSRRIFGLLLLCAVLAGCSSGLEGVEKRLGSMREEITALQNQNDRLVERVDVLEMKQSQAAAAPAATAGPTAAKAGTTERPPLKIVRLVPGEGEPAAAQTGEVSAGEAADDPGPRTVIRGRGSNVEGRLASGEVMAVPGDAEAGRRRKSSASEGEKGQTKDSESSKKSESPKKGD